MHIKTGTWEASSTVCESDTLCDPTVLVSANNPEPHIRNRRLSPGSGSCGGGGGGGGGCVSGGDDKTPRQNSLGGGHALGFRKEKERKGPHKGRSLRRESQKGTGRVTERPQKVTPQGRWVEDSLSLLKPPPAFPVQDSPAKLQPAVSYASKVKAKAASGIAEEERPAIGVLLQNQWGLSFISEARPSSESPGPLGPLPTRSAEAEPRVEPQPGALLTAAAHEESPVPATTSTTITTTSTSTITQPEGEESSEMLLVCRHLVEALNYHSREWNAVCNKQKKVLAKVVWYQEAEENPA